MVLQYTFTNDILFSSALTAIHGCAELPPSMACKMLFVRHPMLLHRAFGHPWPLDVKTSCFQKSSSPNSSASGLRV